MYDEAKHQAWLSYVDKPFLGSTRSDLMAPTGCFACTAPLPAVDDRVCAGCGRISCGICGACCCGRIEYEDGRKVGLIEPWASNSLGRDERRSSQLEELKKIGHYVASKRAKEK